MSFDELSDGVVTIYYSEEGEYDGYELNKEELERVFGEIDVQEDEYGFTVVLNDTSGMYYMTEIKSMCDWCLLRLKEATQIYEAIMFKSDGRIEFELNITDKHPMLDRGDENEY